MECTPHIIVGLVIIKHGESIDSDHLLKELEINRDLFNNNEIEIHITRTMDRGVLSFFRKNMPISEVDKRISDFILLFTHDLKVWRTLNASYEIYLSLGVFLCEFDESFDLSVEVLNMLSKRQIRISFDIYGAIES